MNDRNSARMCETGTEQLETSARPAWLWDPARHRVVWANAAAVTLFGEDGLLSLAERSFDAREPGVVALSAILPALDEAGEKGLPLKLAFPSAGIEMPVDVRVQAHPLPDGWPGILVVACAPAMENSPRFGHVLREVLEAMPLAVAVVDEAARLVYANPAAVALVGEERLGGLRAFLPDEAAARAFLKRAVEAGLSCLNCDLETDASSRRRVRITARPSGEDGGIALFTLVIEDITERSRLEKAMERQVWPPLPQAPDTRQARRDTDVPATNTVAEAVAPASGEVIDSSPETGESAAPSAEDRKAESAMPWRGGRLPLSQEDIRTFHRLSGQASEEAERSGETPETGVPDTSPSETTASPTSTTETAGAASTENADETGRPAAGTESETIDSGKTGAAPSPASQAETAESGKKAAAVEREDRVPAGPEHGQSEPGVAKAAETPVVSRHVGRRAGAADGTAGADGTGSGHTDEETPQVPALVRSVLDHRADPILLHRDAEFLYANRAAREIFGASLTNAKWRAIVETLTNVADGDVARLADADGHIMAFRLSRDVFPWRDGAVVQTTLSPLAEEDGDDAVGSGTISVEDPSARAPGPAATTFAAAGKRAADDRRVAARDAGGRVRILSAAPEVDGNGPATPATDSRVAGDGEGAGRHATDGPGGAGGREAASAGACVQAEPLDEELRAILDTATDGIITLNRDGEILSFSAGAEALFGLRTAEVVGRPFVELLEGDSRKVVEDYMRALTSSDSLAGIYNEGREVTARVAGGGQIPLFITIGRLGRNGEAERPPNKAAFCVVVRDITQWKKTESELRRAKEEAERSSAMKSEFLAAISHELRTPLNAILGFSDVMRNERFGAIGNEKYKGYANDIYQSGEHLLSLINDLLDLSRIEAGKFELSFEDVDVAAIAEEALNLMKEEAAKEKVILRRAIATDLPRVVADARSLKQILLNLLSNAVKFTDSGGQVVLSARMTEKGELEITVSDTGAGMTEEELERALKPFERITGKGRPEKPGTGLGLPLTKALAEANHARFEMESEPGKGTTVRIIFPTQRVLA